MAKKMSYSKNGLDLTDTVWFPAEPNINLYGLAGRITWLGFQTETKARDTLLYLLTNGAAGTKHQPVGEKPYDLSAAQVLQFTLSDTAGANMLERLSTVCYEIAAATLDVDTGTPNPDYNPNTPGSTKNIMESFFAHATDVNISPGG